jgi:5-methylcytosine-specific restriction enzyme A
MPYAAPRVCPHCRRLIPHGQRCPCSPNRSPSAQVGSTRQWRKLRTIKLNNNPICEWPGCRRPAAQVDHIQPVVEHPELEYDYDNTQSLCRPHHQEKTNQDRRRRSGKTDD